MLLVAHVSDTHVGGPPRVRERSEQVVSHLLDMDPRPNVLVVTGDVADHGAPGEYAAAREVLDAWPGPLLVGPGNHDVREPFAEGLLGRAADGPLNQVLEVEDTRFLMLDSLVPAPPGERIDHGELEMDTIAWLDEQLGADDRPTFVCLHHPPLDIGVELMAPIMLRHPDVLADVITQHPHVVATLVGHAHTACTTTFAGLPLLIAGGVASTVLMDAEVDPGRRSVLWEAAPPTFALHLLDEVGRLTTHWRALP